MAKNPLLGHVDCPTCGFSEMEVRDDKNGHAFGFCPDCAQQWRTGNEYRSRKLKVRMRAAPPGSVTVTGTDTSEGETGMPAAPVADAPPAVLGAPPKKRAAACLLDE